MTLTYFYPKMRGNVVNKTNSPVNIRFVPKTSDIRKFSENMRSNVKTLEVTTLACALWTSCLVPTLKFKTIQCTAGTDSMATA